MCNLQTLNLVCKVVVDAQTDIQTDIMSDWDYSFIPTFIPTSCRESDISHMILELRLKCRYNTPFNTPFWRFKDHFFLSLSKRKSLLLSELKSVEAISSCTIMRIFHITVHNFLYWCEVLHPFLVKRGSELSFGLERPDISD